MMGDKQKEATLQITGMTHVQRVLTELKKD